MIKIDKDIAPPECIMFEAPNPGPKSKYPFSEMELGDSFYSETKYSELKRKAVRFTRTRNGSGKHFAVTTCGDGSRCWLVGIDNEN